MTVSSLFASHDFSHPYEIRAVAEDNNAGHDYWYDVEAFLEDVWHRDLGSLSYKQKNWIDEILEAIEEFEE